MLPVPLAVLYATDESACVDDAVDGVLVELAVDGVLAELLVDAVAGIELVLLAVLLFFALWWSPIARALVPTSATMDVMTNIGASLRI